MNTSRRDFLKTSAVTGGVAMASSILGNAYAQGNDVIKVGLIGCGGRGSGAIRQCLRGGENVKLVALGDAFEDRVTGCLNGLNNDQALRGKVDVTKERCFVGLDAAQKVIEQCDLVCLATPPGFRAEQLRLAITARKHVFTEKPVAVDGPGIRTCLEMFELANRNRTAVVAGTQRRYQNSYVESMKRIHEGELGTITSARCYWNQGSLWHRNREQNMTDLQWQLRNWLYFTWLSGDHICEQHVHNLDVINWAFGNGHPVRAVGLGGRQVRTGPEYGQIFDHFAIDYEYPNGVHVLSMCRQIAGCENNVSEAVTGTRGTWAGGSITNTNGERIWGYTRRQAGGDPDPYQQEHVALIESIRKGQPINDLKNVAESTLTAIMGRMSCYTGKAVTWNQALNSTQNLIPANLAWDMNLPVPPVAVPGTTPLV